MKKYFYSDGKEKYGPFSFEELKNESISGVTLIWFEGLEYWVPAKEIAELEEILRLTPPPISMNDSGIKTEKYKESEITNENILQREKRRNSNLEIESISKNHPFRRFFARTIDILLIGLLMFMLFSYVIGLTFPGFIDSYMKFLENPIGVGIAMYLLWIPTEALFLHFIVTTPAKCLFGFYVKSNLGENISFKQSLKRAFQVFVYGEGFGIPIITLFTRLNSYRRLVKKGRTSWDSNVESFIFYEKWSAIKIVASVLAVLATLFLINYMNSVS